MNDVCTYQVRLRGSIDAQEISAMGPVQVRRIRATRETSLFTISTDQSGLIGLLRHLHGLGFVLLSIVRKP